MFDEGFKQDESNDIEQLRLILEREQSRPVSYAEAVEVADSLLEFFETLADHAPSNETGVGAD